MEDTGSKGTESTRDDDTGGTRRQLNVRFPEDVIESMRQAVSDGGGNIQQFTERAVRRELAGLRIRSAEDCLLDMENRLSVPDAGGAAGGKIPTGIGSLDAIIGGMAKGGFTVLAARPAQGKSEVSLAIANHVAGDLRSPVLIVSAEVSGSQLVSRLIASLAHVSLDVFDRDTLLVNEGRLDGEPDRKDRMRRTLAYRSKRLSAAKEKVSGMPLLVDDRAGSSLDDVRESVLRAVGISERKHGARLALVIVDYLQLLSSGSVGPDAKESEIGRGMKALAEETGVAILGLSQLPRAAVGGSARHAVSGTQRRGVFLSAADTVLVLERPHAGEAIAGDEDARDTEVRGMAATISTVPCHRYGVSEVARVIIDDGFSAVVSPPAEVGAEGFEDFIAKYWGSTRQAGSVSFGAVPNGIQKGL